MLVREIYEFINSIAPFSAAESWDNCGLLIGSYNRECKKIMLALDITRSVAKQAIEEGVDLIITHHPVIFTPLKNIDFDSATAKLVMAGICVISSHTCFDVAQGGMNDILCEKLGLQGVRAVTADDGFSFRLGFLDSPISAKDFAKHTADALNSRCVSCTLGDKTVSSVAVCSGSGGSISELVAALRVDAFVTGELKYNNVIDLTEAGISSIVAGHFETEQIFKTDLKERLLEKFSDAEVIVADEKPYLMGV